MKKIISLSMLIALSILPAVQAEVKNNEKAPIALFYCMHSGPGVSYSFQSCVNNNFSSIARVVGGFNSYCSNFGNEVSFSFTSCVNNNFRTVERQLENAVFLQSCFNFDRDKLDFSFISCVNNNFRTIEREIQINH